MKAKLHHAEENKKIFWNNNNILRKDAKFELGCVCKYVYNKPNSMCWILLKSVLKISQLYWRNELTLSS